MSVSDDNNDSSNKNVYKYKKETLILISFSELYSELNTISVDTSKPFSSFTSLSDIVYTKRQKPMGLAWSYIRYKNPIQSI